MPFKFDHKTKNTVVFSRKHLTFSYCFLWEWLDLKFVFIGIIGNVFVVDKAFKNQVLKKKSISGAKYLVVVSFHSVKKRDLSFAQFVYFLRKGDKNQIFRTYYFSKY